MSDYSKLKNVELENLLKERNLPHTGKKADMVKRLQDADASTTDGSAPATSAAPTKTAEDEIDWDDEPGAPPTTAPAQASTKTGTTAQPAQDTSSTQPSEGAESATDPAASSVPAAGDAPLSSAPAKDFTSGIATTTLDDEIEKRKARARKFGTDESQDETLQKLERAKKFGTSAASVDESGVADGKAGLAGRMNAALPERRERKRGREGGSETAGRNAVAPNGGVKGAVTGGSGNKVQKTEGRKAAPGGANGTWMTEADKAKAEARKAKFGS